MQNSRLASAALAGVAWVALAGPASAQAPYTVVMTGLANPRGLAFAPNGALYVAEAGRGGSGPCVTSPIGETRCFGQSGAITRWWKGKQSRVVEGLDSHAMPDGSSASGPNDISFLGTGGAYVTMGLGGNAAFKAALGSTMAGSLLHMSASGRWRFAADVLAYETQANPAGGAIDTNPFGVLAVPGGRWVVDAGGNALLWAAANGRIETAAVFAPQPNPGPVGPPNIEAVPTAVARGPDGALYVTQLTGVPFAPGLASIFRVVPGQAPTIHCTGFKTLMDLAFAADGSLYVVENATGGPFFPANTGQLSRVAPDCSRSTVLVGLDRPTSVAVGPDGAVYVTNYGVSADAGEVLRVGP
jgi:hypothetical protein